MIIALDHWSLLSNNSQSDNKKNMNAKAKNAKEIESFITSLVKAGITISDEGLLAELLINSRDPERELIRAGCGGKGATVRFSADPSAPSGPLTKAFSDIGFDGFCYVDFLTLLRS